MYKSIRKQRIKIIGLVIVLLALWFAFCLPKPLFKDPMSTLLEDRKGVLLAAKIAEDGQWRFPLSDTLPDKFIKSISYFEDEYFFYHPGINPVSLFRAFKQNIAAGKIVSGGSTISMQTIRLARKGQSRTIYQKIIEMIQALRMEITYSKNEILNLYASHAPFGGNVVGLEAASWRYFGRSPEQLSWGEMTALAVLPNAPSLVYPGKNHQKLLIKRNHLLDKLNENGVIDQETCELAKAEPLPGSPKAIPSISPHLLERLVAEGHRGERCMTSIDKSLQEKANRIVNEYFQVYSQNEIYNIAALVIDVESAEVLAYVGNSNCNSDGCGGKVDIITAPRSTGSIMKPFLYTFMLQDGALLPHSLVPDIPTQIAGFSPKNFDESYDGAVPASEALARSLNIPAVRMLQDYGIENFYHQLSKLQLHTINQSANHYGLSIILGGAEATLWDLSNAYLRIAQTLNDKGIQVPASFFSEEEKSYQTVEQDVFDIGALWWTAEALSTLNRPWQESGWQDFQSAQKIAWKTGTSFGHRDAWAIGFTPKHVVAVWVGNADGEGRPGLTGLGMAAPVLFKIFKYLPYEEWFEKPDWDLNPVKVCKESGYLASSICEQTEELMLPKAAIKTGICPFHQLVHLDKNKQFRVTSSCYSVAEMQTVPWFILPPVQEWYFKRKNPFYKSLPPYQAGCDEASSQDMAVIYPKDFTRIFIPRQLDGSIGKAVFEIAHRDLETTIFWHLDQQFLGTSKGQHRMEISPEAGTHQMTLVDEQGESLSWTFDVLER